MENISQDFLESLLTRELVVGLVQEVVSEAKLVEMVMENLCGEEVEVAVQGVVGEMVVEVCR